MRPIHCGTSGDFSTTTGLTWADLDLEPHWQKAIAILNPGTQPRSVQVLALKDQKILKHSRNLIVSAPTNSGKSLIGWLVLLDAVRRGGRALLLEPLRALAREKADELESVSDALGLELGIKLSVQISTGDYRLEDELLSDPPPGGEIIVATPERVEALLRNPANAGWLKTVQAVCVDEAHLISSPQRGLTLECLITSLLCLQHPPRLVLLSATLGELEPAQTWLAPCDVVRVEERQPPLDKWAIALTEDDDANDTVLSWSADHLQDQKAQILIFVYQTRSTQHLVQLLNDKLGAIAGELGALAYHAQMSQRQREKVRQAFLVGQSRVMVTTTALALGINLPATHVLIRDNTFPGVGRLSTSELLQMMGRAGRGDRPGMAAVLVRPKDGWRIEELVTALQMEKLPSLQSALEQGTRRSAQVGEMPPIAPQVATLLSRWHERGTTIEELKTFLGRSLGGQNLVNQVDQGLAWLESHWLAYREPEQGRYFLTVLGKKATRAVLPLPIAASYAQLLRDLMSVDPDDELLKQWRSLDHLLVLNLLSERSPNLRRYSAKLMQQVDAWCEAHPAQTPLLFRKWIWGQPSNSRASEVLGSLGLQAPKNGKEAEEWAHRIGYLAMFRSIVLWERSQGTRIEEVERRFGVKSLEGIEERWRDEMLWLLAGLAKLLDVRTFYYHLKENCAADFKRVKLLKRGLSHLKHQIFELQEQLKYCSPLGALLWEIRRVLHKKGKVGIQSIRRLEEAGFNNLIDLMPLGVEDLVKLGVQRRIAEQLRGYVQQRIR